MSDRTAVGPDLTEVFGPDLLTQGIRGKLRELLRVLIEGELDEKLGAARYARSEERTGYRNGDKARSIHTSLGSIQMDMPRARILKANGRTEEWQSELVPRYERRSKSLDATLVSMYFSGTNLRRIKRTLRPLLCEAPLDKNVVSRLVGRLSGHVEAWKSRSLAQEKYVYLYLDATNLKVRLFKKVRKLPVLVALGVRQDGQKEVLALELLIKESAGAWREVLGDLVRRGLSRPLLAIIDGHPGLRSALDEIWPGIEVQRCTVHIAGRNPRFYRGVMSSSGQIPMSPVAWGQARWSNLSRRSRPDTLASVPSPEARAKSRAAPKGNACGAVNASRTIIAGRVREWGGRGACVPPKTAAAAEAWGSRAVAAPGVLSGGTR